MKENKKMPCETWCRCVGYFRPVSQMNPGKQEEVSERKMMDIRNDTP